MTWMEDIIPPSLHNPLSFSKLASVLHILDATSTSGTFHISSPLKALVGLTLVWLIPNTGYNSLVLTGSGQKLDSCLPISHIWLLMRTSGWVNNCYCKTLIIWKG